MKIKKIISSTLLLALLSTSAIFADVESTNSETTAPSSTDEQTVPSDTEYTEDISDTTPTDLEVLDTLDQNYYNQTPVKPQPPQVPQQAPQAPKVLSLGKSTSNFSSSPANRKFNIKKAASALNGKIVQPGETFDFNRVVGPTSQATGYRNAKVIFDGDFVDGYGGGVCQVSSTLFNACLNSGVDITQRRNHSLRISYYPPGYDAAVNYGSLNFKFKNTYKVPVKIKATADNSNITIELIAMKDTTKKVVSLTREQKGNNSFVLSRKIKENNVIVKKDSFRSNYGEKKK